MAPSATRGHLYKLCLLIRAPSDIPVLTCIIKALSKEFDLVARFPGAAEVLPDNDLKSHRHQLMGGEVRSPWMAQFLPRKPRFDFSHFAGTSEFSRRGFSAQAHRASLQQVTGFMFMGEDRNSRSHCSRVVNLILRMASSAMTRSLEHAQARCSKPIKASHIELRFPISMPISHQCRGR